MGGCLLLFFFLVLFPLYGFAKEVKARPKAEKVILRHADKVTYDQFTNPDVQIFVGNVSFDHNGLVLYCDSANFYQMSNSFRAFGHVRMLQGDTLSLKSEVLFYDGNSQIAEARKKVVLKNRTSVLYTDSLNYDRVYHVGYFFEGGKLVDGENTLTSDWGQYNTSDKQAVFNYHVQFQQKNMRITSDTIHYDTRAKIAHVLGPSNVLNGTSHIYTEDGFYNTVNKNVMLRNRSVVVDENQQMEADSLIYNKEEGISRAYRNIVYNDKKNKNIVTGDYCYHNDLTGYTIAYDRAEVKNYSEKDTLYLHADTFKIYTYNQKTDSVYRVIRGFYHSRSFRTDVQSVADSMSYNSDAAVLSLYGNPIVWNGDRQILGEEIHSFMNDSTIDSIHVVNQALMVEKLDSTHFNQITGKEMRYYFENGKLSENRVNTNVQVIYYAFDDDSIMVGMNYTETSYARMFMGNKKVSKIWTREATGTFYPLAFASKDKSFLSNYGWFDYIRPVNKDDIFVWRAKTAGTELKQTVRRSVPFQELKNIK